MPKAALFDGTNKKPKTQDSLVVAAVVRAKY